MQVVPVPKNHTLALLRFEGCEFLGNTSVRREAGFQPAICDWLVENLPHMFDNHA